MAKNKILAKITMLSAGSAAPYDSAVVRLCLWDTDLVVGSDTYRKGYVVALQKGTASSGDASRGQGGYAAALELKLSIVDRCAVGRLWPLVEGGWVPLVGASVQILNESGDVAPQTWYLHEPKLDGAGITFTLKSMRYLCTKPLSWSAMRYDGAATVGLAVGDAAVQGINAAGRYKGVSVPTEASASAMTTLVRGGIGAYAGSPTSSPAAALERWIDKSFADSSGTVASGDSDWPSGRTFFRFGYPSQALRDADWNANFNPEISGPASTQTLITDGTNTEPIIKRDGSGTCAYSFNGNSNLVYTSGVGTKFTNPPGFGEDTSDLTFRKNSYSGTDTFGNSTTIYCIDIAPSYNGSLVSSSASSVYLIYAQPKNCVCVGASSLVGFQSSDSKEYHTREVVGASSIDGNVLMFAPNQLTGSGFWGWIDLNYSKGFFWNNFGLSASGGNIGWDTPVPNTFTVEKISTPSGMSIKTYHILTGGVHNSYLTFNLFHKIGKDDFFGIKFDNIFVDSHLDFYWSLGGAYVESYINGCVFMDPFSKQLDAGFAQGALTPGVTVDRPLLGFNRIIPYRMYTSFADIVGNSSSNKQQCSVIPVSSNGKQITLLSHIYDIRFYAMSKIAWGSNPAVVVPGNFPGTSNPTTTPAMAIDQLAAWAGLPILRAGGWTPPSGVWGRYLGPDPSSSDSTDPLTVTQAIHNLANEDWAFVAPIGSAAVAPAIESMTPPVLDSSSIDDVVTLPQITYGYAGTSAQFTAEPRNVDQVFDISKGDGYYWGGWQEKDACHLSTQPTTSNVLAMGVLDDCLAIVDSAGYLRRSYDGGVTWPFAQIINSSMTAPTRAAIVAGNGIMVAVAGSARAPVSLYSSDVGRTWTAFTAFATDVIYSGWYDSTTGRLWLCGTPGSSPELWYSTDGATWTPILGPSLEKCPAVSLVVLGSLICLSVYSTEAATYSVYVSTDTGATWALAGSVTQGGSVAPALSYWNGAFRVAVGPTLWSSADLATWTSVALTFTPTDFATDGIVVWSIPNLNSSCTYYSRDQGATWRMVQVSPEGVIWGGTPYGSLIWDATYFCFRSSHFSGKLIALGDPSLLDIWLQCRAAYVKTSTLHSETYDFAGIYDAAVVVSMLLDAEDGIDTEYQRTRLEWMTQQARFATVKVEHADIVEQLSYAAFQRIQIPRQRLEDSQLAANVPTYGLLTKFDPDPMTGISTLEIMMPPL